MWCPAPLLEGERHRRKLRSDKYKLPVGRLLEFYESDSSVKADEDTGDEVGGCDAGAGPDADGAAKPRCRTRSAVGKQSASAIAAAVSAVKAAEKKKKRKRRVASPPAVVTLSILTPRSREVESEEEEEEEEEKDEAIEEFPVAEDRPARRSESPAAKRQRELVKKTSEDALRSGLEVQRAAATAQARMDVTIKPPIFWPKARILTVSR
jgi:ATP-dependent exoDNAse (exonuclease V) beta subunit